MTRAHLTRGAVAGALFVGSFAGAAQGQAASACAGQTHCTEVSSFAATVTDFRQSAASYYRIITTTVRFRNKSDRPLILGYVTGSGIVTDDQGIRYRVGAGGVRGIGEISGRSFDGKFTLQPGETGDARIEFAWRPERAGQIYGTRFEIDLAVREIDQVAANQYQLGREHALHWSGFGEGAVAAAPAATPAATPPFEAPPVAPAVPATDLCAGRTRCHHSGPFVAEVTRLTPSVSGRNHVVTATIRFRNASTQPLILAYKPGTSIAVDDRGNRYGGAASSVTGMGLVQARSADPSFVLSPGQARDATFTVWHKAVAGTVYGTSYAWDFSVEQLEVLASNQIRSVREFAVGFTDLSAGASGNAVDAAARLIGKVLKP